MQKAEEVAMGWPSRENEHQKNIRRNHYTKHERQRTRKLSKENMGSAAAVDVRKRVRKWKSFAAITEGWRVKVDKA